MAQLHHDYQKFTAINTVVLVAVPNGPKMIARHVEQNRTPYLIVSDKGGKVAAQYGAGARQLVALPIYAPAVFIVDLSGMIRYASYASSYIAEPDNREPLAVLAGLQQGKRPEIPLP